MTYEDVFEALADPTRRRIFETLRQGPLSVGAIAKDQPVSRPAVSQHLKVLESARLVNAKQLGNSRVYSIDREGLEALRTYLDGFWTDVLTSFAAEVTRRKLGIED